MLHSLISLLLRLNFSHRCYCHSFALGVKDWIAANPDLAEKLKQLHSYCAFVTDSPLRAGALSSIVTTMIQNGLFAALQKPKRSVVGTYLAQTLTDSDPVTKDLALVKPVKTRWGSGTNEVARLNRLSNATAMVIAAGLNGGAEESGNCSPLVGAI
jgi:hypothetical protein